MCRIVLSRVSCSMSVRVSLAINKHLSDDEISTIKLIPSLFSLFAALRAHQRARCHAVEREKEIKSRDDDKLRHRWSTLWVVVASVIVKKVSFTSAIRRVSGTLWRYRSILPQITCFYFEFIGHMILVCGSVGVGASDRRGEEKTAKKINKRQLDTSSDSEVEREADVEWVTWHFPPSIQVQFGNYVNTSEGRS